MQPGLTHTAWIGSQTIIPFSSVSPLSLVEHFGLYYGFSGSHHARAGTPYLLQKETYLHPKESAKLPNSTKLVNIHSVRIACTFDHTHYDTLQHQSLKYGSYKFLCICSYSSECCFVLTKTLMQLKLHVPSSDWLSILLKNVFSTVGLCSCMSHHRTVEVVQ